MEMQELFRQARSRVQILQRADLLRTFRLRELDDVEAFRFVEGTLHYHHPLSFARPDEELAEMARGFLERLGPGLSVRSDTKFTVGHRAFLSLLSPHGVD